MGTRYLTEPFTYNTTSAGKKPFQNYPKLFPLWQQIKSRNDMLCFWQKIYVISFHADG